jgi:hypothetical protein
LSRGLSAALVAAALLVVPFATAPSASAREPGNCPGSDTVVRGAALIDPCGAPPPAPLPSSVPAAKQVAANTYDAFLRGTASEDELARAEANLGALSGEAIPSTALDPATGYSPRMRLEREFVTLRQVTGYYCGPASVQSILWYLGPHTSAAIDAVKGYRPSLTGDPLYDQPLLADYFWLATDHYESTPWGEYYVPFTINTWRGTNWYVQAATPNAGGALTKDQAWRNIQYDLDHGYPLAVNVLYSGDTIYPAGFRGGIAYQHWDTIFAAYRGADGRDYVRIGEVYGVGGSYKPYQDVPWDEYWPAIGSWLGIVW